MAAEKKIAGAVYRFEPLVGWPAVEALEMLMRIGGAFAPLLEAIAEADDARRAALLGRAIPEALGRLKSGDLRQMIETLMEGCTVNSGSGAYDPAIVGVRPATLDEIGQVAVFLVEAQFSGFFGGGLVKGLLAQAMPPTAAA